MNTIQRYYTEFMDKADPRVEKWFMMDSPIPTVTIVVAYLVLVSQGRKWMRDRKPFDLKPAIMVYNFCLVLLSLYMVFELVMSSWIAPGFSLHCEAVDYSNNPNSVRLAKACWWFYFSKIIELMDTAFFVLRKKNNQITFLHVYHHSTMPILWWIGVKFIPGGESYFSSTVNSGIHVLMYSYYMLSAMGPAMQPYLWWKKYMTTLQLIQFWAGMFKTLYAMHLDCGFPLGYGFALVAYMTSHIILFSNFYYQTYHKKAHQKKLESTNTSNTTSQQSKPYVNGSEQSRLRK